MNCHLRKQRACVPRLTALANLLGSSLGAGALSLGSERREEIFQAGRRPDGDVLVLENQKQARKHRFKVFAGAAAAVALGFVFLNRTQVDTPTLAGAEGETIGLGAPAAAAAQIVSDIEAPAGNEITVEEVSTLQLPLELPELDSEAVRSWLYEEKKILPVGLNSSLAWINTVTPTAEPQLKIDGLGLSAELGRCSWDDSKTLLLVTVQSLRSSDEKSHSLQGSLELEGERVSTASLISEGGGALGAQEMSNLPAGEARLLIYELALKDGSGRPGAIHLDTILRTGSEQNAYLPIPETISSTPGADLEKASLMAAFAHWNQTKGSLEELHQLAKSAERLYPATNVNQDQTRTALDLILLARDFIK